MQGEDGRVTTEAETRVTGPPHQKPEGCPCRFQREHGPDTGPSETEKFQLF